MKTESIQSKQNKFLGLNNLNHVIEATPKLPLNQQGMLPLGGMSSGTQHFESALLTEDDYKMPMKQKPMKKLQKKNSMS